MVRRQDVWATDTWATWFGDKTRMQAILTVKTQIYRMKTIITQTLYVHCHENNMQLQTKVGDRRLGDILVDKTFKRQMRFKGTFQLLILHNNK